MLLNCCRLYESHCSCDHDAMKVSMPQRLEKEKLELHQNRLMVGHVARARHAVTHCSRHALPMVVDMHRQQPVSQGSVPAFC